MKSNDPVSRVLWRMFNIGAVVITIMSMVGCAASGGDIYVGDYCLWSAARAAQYQDTYVTDSNYSFRYRDVSRFGPSNSELRRYDAERRYGRPHR